jgi:hypothetical protein
MGNVLLDFITLGSLAVVVWAVIDVARRPVVALAGKWKAMWIAGAFYLVGPRRRLNSVNYSGRH